MALGKDLLKQMLLEAWFLVRSREVVLELRSRPGSGVQGHIYGTNEQKTHGQVSKKPHCILSWKA